jgi:adenylosuccinate synthase
LTIKEARSKTRIGTTGRGIGPAYEDKVARMGIRVIDLIDKKTFSEKVRQNLEIKNFLIKRFYKEAPIKPRDIIKDYDRFRRLLKPYTADTTAFLHENMEKGRQILFEGAQGTYLDIDTVQTVRHFITLSG